MGSYMQSGDASKRKRYPEPASRPDEMVPMPPRRDALDLYVAAHLAMLHRGTALSSEWTRHDAAIWDRCKATWRSVSPSDKHLIDDIVMREQHFYEIYWAHAAPMGGMVHRSTVRGWEKHTEMFTEQLLGKIRIDCSVLLPGQAPSITANIQAGSSISHLGGTMQHSSRPNGHLHSSYFDPSYSMLPNPTPQRTVHHDLLGLPGQTISPLAGNFYPGSPSQYNALLRGNGMSIPLPQANTVPSSLTPVRSPRPASTNSPQRRRPSRTDPQAESVSTLTRKRSTRGSRDRFRSMNAELMEAKLANQARKSKRSKPDASHASPAGSTSHASMGGLKDKLKKVFS